MTENVLIALIVGVVVIVALVVFILKDRLRSGNIKVNRDGTIQGSMEAHEQSKSSASRNKIKGKKNKLGVYRDGGQIDDNDIKGDDNQINIGKG